jgi:hypothetical protein
MLSFPFFHFRRAYRPKKLMAAGTSLNGRQYRSAYRLRSEKGRFSGTLKKNTQDLDARDPRNTVHTEMMSYGIRGKYVAAQERHFFDKPRNHMRRAYHHNEAE